MAEQIAHNDLDRGSNPFPPNLKVQQCTYHEEMKRKGK